MNYEAFFHIFLEIPKAIFGVALDVSENILGWGDATPVLIGVGIFLVGGLGVLLIKGWYWSVLGVFLGTVSGWILAALLAVVVHSFAFILVIYFFLGAVLIFLGAGAGFLFGYRRDKQKKEITPQGSLENAVIRVYVGSVRSLFNIIFLLGIAGIIIFISFTVYGSHATYQKDQKVLELVKQYETNLDQDCRQFGYFQNYLSAPSSIYKNNRLWVEGICLFNGVIVPRGSVPTCREVRIGYILEKVRGDAPGRATPVSGYFGGVEYYDYKFVKVCSAR